MSTPIYSCSYAYNIAANQAWKALSEAESKALSDQEQASRDTAG